MPKPGDTCEYFCTSCNERGVSKPVPPPPALAIFGLPDGWVLVPVKARDIPDFILCSSCVSDLNNERIRELEAEVEDWRELAESNESSILSEIDRIVGIEGTTWKDLPGIVRKTREACAEKDERIRELEALREMDGDTNERLRERIHVACAELRREAAAVDDSEVFLRIARELEGNSPGAPVEAIGSPTGSQPASALRAGEESDAGAPPLDERVKVAVRWMREHAAAWHGASELLIIADRLEGKA